MSTEVDRYLKSAKTWRDEMAELRAILLGTKLEEDIKWSKPCYCFGGNNVAIMQPFKSKLALMFFKGALLKDPKGLLIDNGPNSQAARRLEFSSVQDIAKKSTTIKSYVKEAIAIEKSGQTVGFKKKPEQLPAELKAAFTKKPKLKDAFEALTPGRQRAYILYFSGAKQSATRLARIEKSAPRILAGKGLNDR